MITSQITVREGEAIIRKAYNNPSWRRRQSYLDGSTFGDNMGSFLEGINRPGTQIPLFPRPTPTQTSIPEFPCDSFPDVYVADIAQALVEQERFGQPLNGLVSDVSSKPRRLSSTPVTSQVGYTKLPSAQGYDSTLEPRCGVRI